MKGITFPFHQFGAEFLCHSTVSSSQACVTVYRVGKKNLLGFFFKGIWKNLNNFLVNPIIFCNNQSFFSPTTPCSHTHSPILHARPIWLHLAIRGIPPSLEACFSRKAKQETPHGLCSAEMVFKLSGN